MTDKMMDIHWNNKKTPLMVKKYGHEKKTNRHSHDFIEIAFVYSGLSLHRVGDEVSLLIPGDIFYILPGVGHEYWKSVNNEVYNCLFYPEVLGEGLESLRQLPLLDQIFNQSTGNRWNKLHINALDRYEIESLLKKLDIETNEMPLGWEIRSKALLTDLLVCLSRIWICHKGSLNKSEQMFLGTAPGLVEILEQSLEKKMSIESIARSLGYNPEYFARMFRKLTGLSPSAYISSTRVALAAEKLLQAGTSITEAAVYAGFDDLNYFSRVFKKETGITPSEFRNLSKR
jgi:AraC-like DNA-binding protein